MECSVVVGRTLAVVALLMITTTIHVAESTSSAINLDISRDLEGDGRVSGLVINCSVDTAAAELDKVATLTLFGSNPYGTRNDLEELASVDIWSTSPKLTEELEEADVYVEGDVTSKSPHLTLTWKSQTLAARHAYRCVANGINKAGQADSVSTTVHQVEPGLGCCQKIDDVQANLNGLSYKVGATFNLTAGVESQLLSLGSRFENVEAECTSVDDKVSGQLQSLADKLEAVEDKVSGLDGKISPQMQKLSDDLKEIKDKLVNFEQSMNSQFRKLGIDKSRFDVSDVYRDRLYLVSKAQAAFDIARDNNLCRLSGGYLVEIDDAQEYQFVYDLVNIIRGANSFWTGGNDIEKDGTYVYYNSKKPVPQLVWSGGQPDHLANEDCMEIRLNFGGLNDWLCNQVGKFVCEVPL